MKKMHGAQSWCSSHEHNVIYLDGFVFELRTKADAGARGIFMPSSVTLVRQSFDRDLTTL